MPPIDDLPPPPKGGGIEDLPPPPGRSISSADKMLDRSMKYFPGGAEGYVDQLTKSGAMAGGVASRLTPKVPTSAPPKVPSPQLERFPGTPLFEQTSKAKAVDALKAAPITETTKKALRLMTNPKAVLLGGAGAYLGKDTLKGAGELASDVLGEVISSMTSERVERLLSENPDIARAIEEKSR